ncbi:hypothetical protein OJAV_G00115440 [Oryzias javanicus]|uniref:Uncharacterized protein n=1 Tax=Oryzias javanicus TaxID=123683 RepID=A0A437CX52_ORYJA|nr:hypothetical protein OJAV_G00115440 [Oryzias javanicus]
MARPADLSVSGSRRCWPVSELSWEKPEPPSCTSPSLPPCPSRRTWRPSAGTAAAGPGTPTASSLRPVTATTGAAGRPSTGWSPGSGCAAAVWWRSSPARSSAAPGRRGLRLCPSSAWRSSPPRRWCTSAARTRGRRAGSASTASCPTPTTAPSRATRPRPCRWSPGSASTPTSARGAAGRPAASVPSSLHPYLALAAQKQSKTEGQSLYRTSGKDSDHELMT